MIRGDEDEYKYIKDVNNDKRLKYFNWTLKINRKNENQT